MHAALVVPWPFILQRRRITPFVTLFCDRNDSEAWVRGQLATGAVSSAEGCKGLVKGALRTANRSRHQGLQVMFVTQR